MENARIAAILDEIADLLELEEGNEFRIRSYRGAARTVRDLSRRLEDMVAEEEDLSELPNIGKSTAEKIAEIVETGTCERVEELRKEVPSGLTEILKVPGLGAKKAMLLHRELGIDGLEELRKACKEERVRTLEGMGERTEEKILEGLKTLGAASGRFGIKEAADHVASLERLLEDVDAVARHAVAGSFRRRKETVGDLDVLIEAKDRKAAAGAILERCGPAEVIGRGKEKLSLRLESGLQVDFRFFEEENFGSALIYFTGSKAHNVRLRRLVQEKGWKLNEYGLLKGDRRLAGRTEEAVYRRMGLDWIPPELREDRGEIDAAREGALPRLVEAKDLRGDLHAHTDVTDGAVPLEDMVEAARAQRFQYLAVTDHSRAVAMAHGLTASRLEKHADRIREIDGEVDDLWVLAGIEVDIGKDGRLDLPEDVLAGLDWVVASVHYDRNQGEKAMTDRLVSAVRSGVVDCLGHPLGRLIGSREPLALDADRVFEACAEEDVFLEINAQPERLDLPDTHCRRAKEAGARFVISTDAHKPSDFDFQRFGVDVARRGWLERKDVVNTKTLSSFRKLVEERRG